MRPATTGKVRFTLSAPFLLVVFSLIFLAACGENNDGNVAQEPLREARPTFTPTITAPQPATESTPVQSNPEATPVAPVADTPQPQPTSEQESQASQGSEPVDNKPIVVINDELVNTREGPGINFDLVEMVERGQQFDIVGKTPDGGWWKICCVNDKQVWVVNEFVQTDGDTGSVQVISDFAPGSQATAAPIVANPTPAAQPTATTPPPAAALGFDLITQEQFPETNVVRMFLFVFEGSVALDGYTLRVLHNGTELSTNGAVSIGPNPGLTWPISDTRQRLQNYKVEFPGEQPSGTWEAQLMLNNQPVGPVATFKLDENEKEREMYVRYQKK